MLYLYSWNPKSEGARQLALQSGFKRLRHQGSTYRGSKDRTVINWGSRTCPEEVMKSTIVNPPHLVERAANKLSFFKLMDQPNGPRIPPYSVHSDDAITWLVDNHKVCIRATVNGHSGIGLTIANRNSIDTLIPAPLYTLYIPKKHEYRIHFAFGKIIDIQRKALRTTDEDGNPITHEEIDWKIRNLANGFVFIRNDIKCPDDVLLQAELAYKLTELNFGAVDVIWNEKEKKAYVLEINTAPGLCNTTITSYTKAFKEKFTPGAL